MRVSEQVLEQVSEQVLEQSQQTNALGAEFKALVEGMHKNRFLVSKFTSELREACKVIASGEYNRSFIGKSKRGAMKAPGSPRVLR